MSLFSVFTLLGGLAFILLLIYVADVLFAILR